jgi:hypothetical protein
MSCTRTVPLKRCDTTKVMWPISLHDGALEAFSDQDSDSNQEELYVL